MDVSRLIDWAQRAYPYDGTVPIPSPRQGERGPAQAAGQLARAYEYHQSGRLRENGTQHFAYGLTTLATMLMEQGDSDPAAATFQTALQAFTTLPPGSNVDRVMEYCRRCLQGLGSSESDELPPLFDEPVLSLADLLGVPSASVSPAAEAEAEAEEEVEEEVEEEPVQPAEHLALKEGLTTYFEALTKHSHLTRRSFGRTWIQDLEAARGRLPEELPAEHSDLISTARQFRGSGWTNISERRIASLQAALVNYHLWAGPDGLRSNEPQLRVDLLRYAAAALDEGLRKSSRDLILGSVEAQVAVAHGTPTILLRNSLLDTLLGAVGTYLLLAGPNPAQPQEIEYDERIHNHLGGSGSKEGQGLFNRGRAVKERRSLWPVHLLKQWQNGQDMDEASFALASAAGWDRSCARWLVDQLFAATPDPDAHVDLAFWQTAVDRLLTAISKVDVVCNPWAPRDSDFTQSSVITSDRAGRMWVPDPVLKAVVAQGLEMGDTVKVWGENFAGRRMPTYLLTNKWGPVSILKIDYADRVVREEENFHRYAEARLHQKYRPSRCEARDMEMYLGEEGQPLRAIVTSYAFEETEEALTLGSWFATAAADEAEKAVQRLLLTTMRSWITDIRRDRVDLRAEYPIFRPAAAPDKQSPESWAGSELATLADSVMEELVGLSLPEQAEQSARSLVGKSLGLHYAASRMHGLELINPLWFAASVAGLDGPTLETLDRLVDPKAIDLRDYETLLVLAHGDLHMDNVLCTRDGPSLDQAILIDFESAHYGHVCKDFARLEACVLTHVFEWSPEEAGRIAEIVVTNTDLAPPFDGDRYPAPFDSLPDRERLVLSTVRRLRQAAFGCGQGNWPIPMHEYQLALAGSLIPMIRSTGMTKQQRQFALTLSTLVCSALLESWRQDSGAY